MLSSINRNKRVRVNAIYYKVIFEIITFETIGEDHVTHLLDVLDQHLGGRLAEYLRYQSS
jgi:hypothetical protein